MRILFVTPYIPSRIRVRSFNLIKTLSATHDISLVSLLVDDYERALVKEIEEYCVSVDLVSLSKWQAYMNCLQALLTPVPLRVAYYRSSAFTQRILEVVHRQQIDVVHGELIKVVPALQAVLAQENIPVLFDSVDCITWYLKQAKETTHNFLKKAFIGSELWKMCRYERKVLADFDKVIISGKFDRETLGGMSGQIHNIEVISNGVDINYFASEPAPQASDSLVFCAKLDYFPNTQAIIHFCQHVLPLIWQQRPQVRLTIVGNNPPKAVRMLAADKRITVTGYVPDVRPYLSTASIAIAPLLVAAGTQFKVLEALSMCTPTVTTPRCARALGTEHGVHLLVAEEPPEIAQAILRLLNDPLYARKLGEAGRQFVVEHYSWANAAHLLEKLYASIVATPEQVGQMVHVAVSTENRQDP